MATQDPTHAQHALDLWKQVLDQQAKHVEVVMTELGRLERQQLDRATATLDELAAAGRATLGYAVELSDQWRKVALEAARTMGTLLTPGA